MINNNFYIDTNKLTKDSTGFEVMTNLLKPTPMVHMTPLSKLFTPKKSTG